MMRFTVRKITMISFLHSVALPVLLMLVIVLAIFKGLNKLKKTRAPTPYEPPEPKNVVGHQQGTKAKTSKDQPDRVWFRGGKGPLGFFRFLLKR